MQPDTSSSSEYETDEAEEELYEDWELYEDCLSHLSDSEGSQSSFDHVDLDYADSTLSDFEMDRLDIESKLEIENPSESKNLESSRNEEEFVVERRKSFGSSSSGNAESGVVGSREKLRESFSWDAFPSRSFLASESGNEAEILSYFDEPAKPRAS